MPSPVADITPEAVEQALRYLADPAELATSTLCELRSVRDRSLRDATSMGAALQVVRATGGRIVNIGSTSGRMALPYIGPYAASKFALRVLTDSLRVELAPWGIAVCLVEPGNVSTPIWNKSKSLGIDLLTGRTGIRTRGQSHHDRAMQTIEQTADSSLSPGT